MKDRIKFVTGVLACAGFAATICCFIMGAPRTITIVMLLLHSVCLIVLAFLFSADRNDYTETDELQQELSALRAEADADKQTMQRALDAREKELSEKEEQLKSLEEDVKSKGEEIDRLEAAVKVAEEEADFAKTEINDFLPKTDEEVKRIDIIAVAKGTIDEFSADAAKAGINMRISSAEDSLFVMAQPSRLRIMFRNIIDNSIKYMNRSGSLVVTISTIDDDIFIVLKDTGEGLAEDETKHIFELNFQGSNRISGNGLGLTQAKAIVESYGGTIYGQSTPGKGMGIYIQLPTNKREKETS
ncbi:MAG: hypothetical protein IKO80_03720 [Lachnospiraceae bacterium]|nr:hypothetical protein [Lachnospiraceae bacterium]